MTKKIRVENADLSSYKAEVEVWEMGYNGAPDTKVETIHLDLPTSLIETFITSTRYLIIKEKVIADD